MHPIIIALGLGAVAFFVKKGKKSAEVKGDKHWLAIVNFPSAVSDEGEAADWLLVQTPNLFGLTAEEVLGVAANDGSRPQRTYIVSGYNDEASLGYGSLKPGAKIGDAKVTTVYTAPTQAALADKLRGIKLYKVTG